MTASFRKGRKTRRLVLIGVAGAVLALAASLVFYALGDKITYAPTPSELAEGSHGPGSRIRLGGLVEEGSIARGENGLVTFAVTDRLARIPVQYVGILPDLFREGQGVVAEGTLGPTGLLVADTVLARHDENYMPKEVVDSLKASGQWQHEAGAASAGGAQGAQ